MIDLVMINVWELFKTMWTVMAVVEFNNIIFKDSGKTFELIQADFNQNICIVDENSDEVKAWKEKHENRNMERQGYPVTA